MDPILVSLGGAVIASLVSVVVFLFKRLDAERDKRLADAVEARDKISEPISQLISLSEKIYDALPETKRGK